MADFADLTLEEKRAYAAEQVAYWRAIQRDLDRHASALTVEEKTAIEGRLVDAAKEMKVVVEKETREK